MNLKAMIKAAADRIKPSPTLEGKEKYFISDFFYDVERYAQNNSNLSGARSLYRVSADDWYKTFPYRFVIKWNNNGKTQRILYYSLPIPPESLSYQMVSASQLTPTLGGVVEETSQNLFWQISLAGTTGIAISRAYQNPKDNPEFSYDYANNPYAAEPLFSSQKTIEGLDEPASQEANFRKILKGGIFANTLNKLSNIKDAVSGAIDDPQSGMYGLLEGLASTNQRFNKSAVPTSITESRTEITDIGGISAFQDVASKANASTNGYVEIHILHNFLNAYSKLKEIYPEDVSLYFESQKDNMQWQVIVKGFGFQKSAAQPYLYKYNISLQGFDLKETGEFGKRKVVDRFGPNGDLGNVSSFTLSGALERSQSLARKIQTNPLGLIASKPPII